MPNPFTRLVNPRLPSTALGFEKGLATMVQLDRARNGQSTLRRAASVPLSDSLIQPAFAEPNISDQAELAAALRELATTAGLLQQKRWSVALPDASSRTLIVTLESAPPSGSELEEVLTWKMERGFGLPMDELAVSRERLPADDHGRGRYLVIATSAYVLAEYESVLQLLGWRAGLILPRHMGEGQWLTQNGSQGDALLLSSSEIGFTAVVFRGKLPLIVRTVNCDAEECEDELYRLLLLYRDRRSGETDQPGQLAKLLVVGNLVAKDRAGEIVSETLGTEVRALDARDFGLQLPSRELSFDSIAAPVGLATLSWQ